jgi:hypothetical protein
MPLGGYCEVCGRWVWVDRAGGCQFGHSSDRVRDVQPLKSRGRGGSLPAKVESGLPATRARDRWWWRNSLWVGWTLTLGFLNWLAFFYIGVRARHAPWIFWGFLYLAPLLLTIATIGTGYLAWAIAFQLLMSAMSFLHAALVRPQYRAVMRGEPPAAPPAPPFLWSPNRRPALPRGLEADVADTLIEAQAQVDEIAHAAEGIGKPEMRARIAHLCRTADMILGELREHPRQVPLARSFLVYYLDAADRIVRGYAELAHSQAVSPDIRGTLDHAEASLDGMQAAFDSQYAALLQQQQLDLDTEIALLERTARADNVQGLPGAAGLPEPHAPVSPTKTRGR